LDGGVSLHLKQLFQSFEKGEGEGERRGGVHKTNTN
jgi:hypothetical protein